MDKIQIWNFYAPYSRAWQFTIGFLGYFASSQSTRKIQFKKSVQFFISALVLIVLFLFLCDSQIVNSSIVTLTTLTLIVTKSLYVLPNSFGKFLHGLEIGHTQFTCTTCLWSFWQRILRLFII